MSDAPEQDIATRLRSIEARVREAVGRRGPGPDVTLIGVSKRQPIEKLRAAHDAGLRDFGENYAQELRDKAKALSDLELRWHFIGALQSNKAKMVVGKGLVHTVDRPSLLAALAKRAAGEQLVQEVLIEVNFDEPQKAGVLPGEAAALLDGFADHPSLRCLGLMVIPPIGPPEQTRGHFQELRRLRDSLAQRPRAGVELRHLSMGMSSDFEVAIEEGATLVRVGTAIFGPRPS